MTTDGLRANMTVERADFRLSADLALPPGGRLAVLGPNGSGKSTLLSALAGLVPLSRGEVTLDGRLLERAGGIRLRADQRRIGLLDQKPRLFPHLSVAQNIAFGPRARGVRRGAALRMAADWLSRLGLADRGDAAPHELSGGQQQRVAIARAFAADPVLILLDEPFAALDAESAPAVRRLLTEELERTGTAAVMVTHALADAWQLADDCIVLHDGAAVERGTPAELAARPRHPFTARLGGFSVVEGRWTGTALDIGDGILLAGTPEQGLSRGDAAFAVISPQNVTLCADADAVGTAHSVQVSSLSSQGGVLRLEHRSGLAVAAPVDAVGGRSLPRIGDTVRLRVEAVPVRRSPH